MPYIINREDPKKYVDVLFFCFERLFVKETLPQDGSRKSNLEKLRLVIFI